MVVVTGVRYQRGPEVSLGGTFGEENQVGCRDVEDNIQYDEHEANCGRNTQEPEYGPVPTVT
jgi:hypothetical protein